MMQDLNRRRFLGAAVATGAGAAAAGSWAPAAAAQGGGGRHNVPNNRIGIQLYTLRRLMPEGDRRAVRSMLRWLGRVGYTEVELAGYYGFSPAQLRRWLDDAGLRAASGHDALDITSPDGEWETAYEATLEGANLLGQQFTGLAWHAGPHTVERYTALADRLNKAGQMAAEAGLQFFYHNHNFEFENKQPDGTPLYDILLDETNPDFVKFEMDLYWIIAGGESPIDYLARDPARWPLYHVKDRTWKDRPGEEDWEDVGPGAIDWPQIFEAGVGRRTDTHYVVEHDWPPLSHPNDANAEYTTARAGVDYLRQVRW